MAGESIMRLEFDCRPLAPFDESNLESARGAFSSSPSLRFRQAWRRLPEEGFRPAVARVGFLGSAVAVLADFEGEGIESLPAGFNDAAFMVGDAFEMFFAPDGQSSYYEFHVTPDNSRLQLRFPRPGAARKRASPDGSHLDPFKVWEPLFESRVFKRPGGGGWSVLAKVPLSSIVEKGEGDWPAVRFSLCRYDWGAFPGRPTVSSTSEHALCDFHRIEEWNIMRVRR